MERVGDAFSRVHLDTQHVNFGDSGAGVATVGGAIKNVGTRFTKKAKQQEKDANKAAKQAKKDAEAAKADKLNSPAVHAEITRHVRRLNSPNAGDATTVQQSHKLIEKFGGVQQYRDRIAQHPEFKRHLHTVLSSTQFKNNRSTATTPRRPQQSPWEYSGHASR